ncbi:hypothetical protein [Micromonospora saelicesensis]|nr:hypothetical protein [Micromonospora saelicesensis]
MSQRREQHRHQKNSGERQQQHRSRSTDTRHHDAGQTSTGLTMPAAPQLVTVEGTVIRFSHRDLTGRYHLGPPGPYRAFEGGRALVARELTVW